MPSGMCISFPSSDFNLIYIGVYYLVVEINEREDSSIRCPGACANQVGGYDCVDGGRMTKIILISM